MKKVQNDNIEEVIKEESSETVEEAKTVEAVTNNNTANSAAANQSTMLDVPTALTTVIARTEATAIIVAVINAVIDALQKRDIKVTQEELGKLQGVINSETDRTDRLYREVERVLNNAIASNKSDVPDSVEVADN